MRSHTRQSAGLVAAGCVVALLAADAQEAPMPHLSLELEAAASYLEGLPMLVAVDVGNVSSKSTFYGFQEFDLFTAPPPARLVLTRGEDAAVIHLPAARPNMEDPGSAAFRPGQRWRALVDLHELRPSLEPGRYTLEGGFSVGMRRVSAEPVRFEIVPACEGDRVRAAELRAQTPGRASWFGVVRRNARALDASALSPAGHSQLAYYLFLHRAAWGPDAVADLDPAAADAFAWGAQEPEAALTRLEIAHARGEAIDADASALLSRWPGLAWRVAELREARGRLSVLRTTFGAERPGLPEDALLPYREEEE